MDKKTLRRIIEEEKAQYKLNKKILQEHKKLAAERKDFESLFIKNLLENRVGYPVDIHSIDEGAWDALKRGVGKMFGRGKDEEAEAPPEGEEGAEGAEGEEAPEGGKGGGYSRWEGFKHFLSKAGSLEKGGSMFGRGRRTQQAQEELQAALDASADQGVQSLVKGLQDKYPGWPNTKGTQEFKDAATEIAQLYDSVLEAAQKGDYDPVAANSVINALRKVVDHAREYQLADIYKHTNEMLRRDRDWSVEPLTENELMNEISVGAAFDIWNTIQKGRQTVRQVKRGKRMYDQLARTQTRKQGRGGDLNRRQSDAMERLEDAGFGDDASEDQLMSDAEKQGRYEAPPSDDEPTSRTAKMGSTAPDPDPGEDEEPGTSEQAPYEDEEPGTSEQAPYEDEEPARSRTGTAGTAASAGAQAASAGMSTATMLGIAGVAAGVAALAVGRWKMYKSSRTQQLGDLLKVMAPLPDADEAKSPLKGGEQEIPPKTKGKEEPPPGVDPETGQQTGVDQPPGPGTETPGVDQPPVGPGPVGPGPGPTTPGPGPTTPGPGPTGPEVDPETAAKRGDIYVFRGKAGKGMQSQFARGGIKGGDMSRLLKGLRSDLTAAGFNVLEEAKREMIALVQTLEALEQIQDPAQKELAKAAIVQMLRQHKVKLDPQSSMALRPAEAGAETAETVKGGPGAEAQAAAAETVKGGPGADAQLAAAETVKGGPGAAAQAAEEEEEEEAETVKQLAEELSTFSRWGEIAGILKG
jgi:hypothetical protein